MHRLHALVLWLNRHRRVGCLLFVLFYLAFCLMTSVAFSLTHRSALSCGNLDIGNRGSSLSVQKQSVRCFVQAHQQCQPATLQINEYGTDIFKQETLATANDFGGCRITVDEPSRFGIVNVMNTLFPLNVLFLEEMTCQSLSLQPTGLVLQSCELRWQSYASLHILWWDP
ncbi:MAG TPA: hypothetical protein VFV38_25205 [Ktedonobacteraceae bacterium]|nr:hypothetical protein [Ktedonobacteraceae bacterium]